MANSLDHIRLNLHASNHARTKKKNIKDKRIEQNLYINRDTLCKPHSKLSSASLPLKTWGSILAEEALDQVIALTIGSP